MHLRRSMRGRILDGGLSSDAGRPDGFFGGGADDSKEFSSALSTLRPGDPRHERRIQSLRIHRASTERPFEGRRRRY